MRIAITGASGVIGRALTKHLLAYPPTDHRKLSIVGCDVNTSEHPADPRLRTFIGDLIEPQVRSKLLREGVDICFHLAALDGVTAEINPELSTSTNLMASLGLFNDLANLPNQPRVIFTSSITVHNIARLQVIDDASAVDPRMTFGIHKAMAELALLDLTRRQDVQGISLRFATIIPRPPEPEGRNNAWTRNAFLSDFFRSFRTGDPIGVPVSPAIPIALMSVQRMVANLMHAAALPSAQLPDDGAILLPMLHVPLLEVAQTLSEITGQPSSVIRWIPDAARDRDFATFPRILAERAERLGFRAEASSRELSELVFASIF